MIVKCVGVLFVEGFLYIIAFSVCECDLIGSNVVFVV